MDTPKIRFKINIKLDKWKINNFLYRKDKGGISFKQLILKTHPKIKSMYGLEKRDAEKHIFSYINNVYSKNKDGFEKTIYKMQSDWEKIEEDFFSITKNYFQNSEWPKGRYIAYFSISPPMPRFIDSKTFQVSYTHNGRWRTTVAHEMLHFIFFEHVRRKYTPNLSNTIENKMNTLLKNKFMISLWDLSEIINVILLNEKDFQKILPYPSTPYPKHENHYSKMKSIWKKSNMKIDKFLENLEIH